jgi:ribonucleoside-diphosphate reductase alpha chain
VGDGVIKIVNNTVGLALSRLGYGDPEIKAIVDYIGENDTIEGAPFLSEDHLAVFDCAFKPARGVRAISTMGHLRMMASVQPFLSGAISKTVNCPAETTPGEIAKLFIEGWKLGLKAIAIYRDGSKRTQPLSTSLKAETKAKPVRRRLSSERRSITHKFAVGGHEGYLTVGLYEDGTPGEIFVTMAKEGSVVSGLMHAVAELSSISLQYGVPLSVLVKKFAHTRFEPSGYTENPQIPFATSVVDYVFRWMAQKFMQVEGAQGESPPVAEAAEPPRLMVEAHERTGTPTPLDAPPCHECGMIMTRNGSCYKCLNCGSTSGCS